MKNGEHAIGLFQGIDKNILTFNPGWSSDAQQLKRIHGHSRVAAPVQRSWRKHDFQKQTKALLARLSFMIVDPDGNKILVDQHV